MSKMNRSSSTGDRGDRLNRRPTESVLRSVRVHSLAALLGLYIVAGCAATPSGREPAILFERISVDEFAQRIATSAFEEPTAHIIGSITGAAVGPARQVFVSDFMQREVREYDQRGMFVGVVGGTGRGPGEYFAPTSISLSPDGSEIAVNDLGNRVLIRYSIATRRFLGAHNWAHRPMSVHSSLMLKTGGLLFLGKPGDPRRNPYHGILASPSGDSTLREVLALPRNLQKPLAMNVVHGIGGEATEYLFLGFHGSGTIYKVSRDGEVIDSLRLPSEIVRDVELPDTGFASTRDLQVLVESQPWLWSITALSDSLLLLEVSEYSDSAEAWHQSHSLVRWSGAVKKMWTAPSCDCRALGHRGDTLAWLRGGPPDKPYQLEWRVVRTRELLK